MVSGLHIFWGVFRIPIESWTHSMSNIGLFFVIAVFYLSANIGSAISVKLITVLEKKKIYVRYSTYMIIYMCVNIEFLI